MPELLSVSMRWAVWFASEASSRMLISSGIFLPNALTMAPPPALMSLIARS